MIDTQRKTDRSRRRRGWLAWTLLTLTLPAFGQETWTLVDAVRRAVAVAPELQQADAELSAQQAAMRQQMAWPNPELELRADDKIGKESGTGGRDFTQLALSQPLPVFSSKRQRTREAADAEWRAAQFARQEQMLTVEAATAQIFHDLQRAQAQWQLAQQVLERADALQQAAQRRKQAGELSRLEKLRLDILREQAQQAVDREEGELGEVYARFRTRLQLPAQPVPVLEALAPVSPPPPLEELQARLLDHALLQNATLRTKAAYSNVAVARAERIPEPVLRLFHERDFLDGRVQNVTGVGVGISVPLWDRNRAGIKAAQARVSAASIEAAARETTLRAELEQRHIHLRHLLQQASHFQQRVLQPAREVLELTRKGYTAGEAEILALVDAHDTYFDAQSRYFDLLHDAGVEAAQLRSAAGRSLLDEDK